MWVKWFTPTPLIPWEDESSSMNLGHEIKKQMNGGWGQNYVWGSRDAFTIAYHNLKAGRYWCDGFTNDLMASGCLHCCLYISLKLKGCLYNCFYNDLKIEDCFLFNIFNMIWGSRDAYTVAVTMIWKLQDALCWLPNDLKVEGCVL